MGKSYDNKNTGALYINDRKRDDDDSTLSGMLFIGDVEHWFDGWVSEDNQQYDLEFRPKRAKGATKGKGTIKRTDKEGQKPTYPDWKGKITTAKGDEYWISGWKKPPSGKATKPYLSFSIEPVEKKRSSGNQATTPNDNDCPL